MYDQNYFDLEVASIQEDSSDDGGCDKEEADKDNSDSKEVVHDKEDKQEKTHEREAEVQEADKEEDDKDCPGSLEECLQACVPVREILELGFILCNNECRARCGR